MESPAMRAAMAPVLPLPFGAGAARDCPIQRCRAIALTAQPRVAVTAWVLVAHRLSHPH